MKSTKGKNIIVAVAISAILFVGSGAQASSLFALDGKPALAERQIGLFEQALQWLSGTWTDLKVAFSENEAPPTPTPTCTNPNGCGADDDAGWTIDPEG